MKVRSALLALVLTASFGVPAQAQTPARTAIIVAPIPSTDMTPLYYAIQQGLFDKAGLDVTVSQASSGAASMQAVIGRAADIGFGNTLALATAHAKGIPVVLVSSGSLYRTEIPNDLLVVPPDSPAKTAKDMEGKTVAVTGLHDLLGVAVLAWMEQNGGNPAKVNFVEMPAATMQPALQAKRIDFAILYEPFLGTMLRSGAAKRFAAPFAAIAPNFVSSAFFAMGPWATEHRDAVLAFARVMSQATKYVDGHYDTLLPLISQFSKIPVDTLKGMEPVYLAPNLDPKNIQPVINAAVKSKDLTSSFRAADMIFPGVP